MIELDFFFMKKKFVNFAAIKKKKVEKRTEELKQTLSEVQALKVQQDGDYFLTSLLLKPLGVNHVNSKNYTVDFFLKQKKEETREARDTQRHCTPATPHHVFKSLPELQR